MAESWYEVLDRANALGLEYGRNGIINGETTPLDDPLNEGEVYFTARDLAEQLTGDSSSFDKLKEWEVEDISSHWTDGYHAAEWPGK